MVGGGQSQQVHQIQVETGVGQAEIDIETDFRRRAVVEEESTVLFPNGHPHLEVIIDAS